MDVTPPWDSEKRVEDDRPERVFWQSSQNPQRFLDRVMNEMGSLTSDSRSSSSSTAFECVASAPSITTVTGKRKHFDISPYPSYSSYPVSVAGPEAKRSRARSRRSLASRESTPQGPKRSNQTSSSGTSLDVDLDRITKLVKNVSQSLYSRSAPIATTASSRTSQPKGQTKELHDTTNGSKSALESNMTGPVPLMTAKRSDSLSRPIPSSQPCRINGNKDLTSKNLLQVIPQESSQSRRGPSPPTQFPKSITLPPSTRPPVLQSRSVNTRPLGLKGVPSGRSLQEVITKPFKVPFAVADAKKHVGDPPQPSSITGTPSHPEPSLPPEPVTGSSKREISSSSDSFEMDSFGDDHQAIEACLSQYD